VFEDDTLTVDIPPFAKMFVGYVHETSQDNLQMLGSYLLLAVLPSPPKRRRQNPFGYVTHERLLCLAGGIINGNVQCRSCSELALVSKAGFTVVEVFSYVDRILIPNNTTVETSKNLK
jgi:hypothetical protein